MDYLKMNYQLHGYHSWLTTISLCKHTLQQIPSWKIHPFYECKHESVGLFPIKSQETSSQKILLASRTPAERFRCNSQLTLDEFQKRRAARVARDHMITGELQAPNGTLLFNNRHESSDWSEAKNSSVWGRLAVWFNFFFFTCVIDAENICSVRRKEVCLVIITIFHCK